MPRPNLDADVIGGSYTNWNSLTQAGIVRPIFFVYINWGAYSLSSLSAFYNDGLSWSNTGVVLDIDFPSENINGREKSEFSIALTGLNSSILTSALNARHERGFPSASYDVPVASIDVWFVKADGHIDTQASYNMCSGLMDSTEVNYTPDGTIVRLTFQASTDWLWDRPTGGRYTDAYQKSRPHYGISYSSDAASNSKYFYNDEGFKFMEALQAWEVFWGKPTGHKKPHKHQTPPKPTKRRQRR